MKAVGFVCCLACAYAVGFAAEQPSQTGSISPEYFRDNEAIQILAPNGTQVLTAALGDTAVYTIWAGQHIDVGDVLVWGYSDSIYVRANMDGDWVMTQMQMAYADSCAGLPRNRNGELVPGQFPYQATFAPPVTTFTFSFPLGNRGPGDSICIAVHVVVEIRDGDTVIQQETGWAHEWKGCFWYVIETCRRDVGAAEILAPKDTVDPGTTFYPKAVIRNFGDQLAFDFSARFRIGSTYDTVIWYPETLAVGESDTVTFGKPWVAGPTGLHVTSCSTRYSLDERPSNDKVMSWVYVRETGRRHDVGAVQILVPRGEVDSGAAITPRAEIHNYGDYRETFWVTFAVGTGYRESLWTSLSVGQTDTVAFSPAWNALLRGPHPTICYTQLGVDQDRSNDTVAGSVDVCVHDVGAISIGWPVGLIDSGTTAAPRALIANYGNRAERFRVSFEIGSVYEDTLWTSLAVGETAAVDFTSWTAQPIGHKVAVCYTELVPDVDRSNDTVDAGLCVIPPVLPRHDVGAVAVIAPAGQVNQGTAITPRARIGNFGDSTEIFPVTFTIDPNYSETRTCTLAANRYVELDFPSWSAGPTGGRSCVCFTALGTDMFHFNDTAFGSVEVVTGPYHDVAAIAILAPTGAVDSGAVQTPSARVANLGNRTETFPVTFQIGTGYDQTIPSVTLNPGDTTTLYFASWTAGDLGLQTTRCFTSLAADENRSNDTVRGSVTVRALPKDVGVVTILAPTDTVDSGTVVTPKAVVHRFLDDDAIAGEGLDVTFPVVMNIGASYADTVTVTMPNVGSRTVEFAPAWVAGPLGSVACVCYTVLIADPDRSNDTAYGAVEVVSPPPVPRHDVGAVAILAPLGTVGYSTVHTPSARIRNFGNQTETFPVVFLIGTTYADTMTQTLVPGESADVMFSHWTANVPGNHAVTCWTELVADENRSNDTVRNSVTVGDSIQPVHDVAAVAILAPTGTVDSGAAQTPSARVTNVGSRSETFPVTFRIGTAYTSVIPQVTVNPGDTMTIFFESWTPATPGTQATTCFTGLENDEHRLNDTVRGDVTVNPTPARHDVGAVSILEPRGTVEYGSTHVPKAIVRNHGNRVETFPVTFRIGAEWADQIPAVSLAPNQETTLLFREWVGAPIGKHGLVCFTALDADEDRQNDTVLGLVRGQFDSVEVLPVPVHDVGAIDILVPTGEVDWGTVHTPSVRVANFGNRTDAFPVTLTIGADYAQTVQHTLAPGETATVIFPHWTAQTVGTQAMVCFTALEIDQDRANDTARSNVDVIDARHDMGTVEILAPVGRQEVDRSPWKAPVVPRAKIKNFGGRAESGFPVILRIEKKLDTLARETVYEQEQVVSWAVGPDASVELAFPGTELEYGSYVVTCSTGLANDADPSNDKKVAEFEVTIGVGGLDRVVRIYTRAGEFIRELSVTKSREPWFDWDGKNEQGQPVSRGTYLCLVFDSGSAEQAVIDRYCVSVPAEAKTVRLSLKDGR